MLGAVKLHATEHLQLVSANATFHFYLVISELISYLDKQDIDIYQGNTCLTVLAPHLSEILISSWPVAVLPHIVCSIIQHAQVTTVECSDVS